MFELNGIEAWSKDETGDWSRDCKIGRERADALQAHVALTGNYPALGHLVRMIAGRTSGLEAGFYQRIAELMMR